MSAKKNTLRVSDNVVNITINTGPVKPTGLYDLQGKCTEHKAPCSSSGTTCSPKVTES